MRHQQGRIDSKHIVRILKKLIEPASGGCVLGHVFPQVADLPAGALGLVEEQVEQHASIAGLVSCSEQLIGECLVEPAGRRAGAAAVSYRHGRRARAAHPPR